MAFHGIINELNSQIQIVKEDDLGYKTLLDKEAAHYRAEVKEAKKQVSQMEEKID